MHQDKKFSKLVLEGVKKVSVLQGGPSTHNGHSVDERAMEYGTSHWNQYRLDGGSKELVTHKQR
jgi:hypothetical protein